MERHAYYLFTSRDRRMPGSRTRRDGETERRRRKGMKDKTATGRGRAGEGGGGREERRKRATARMRGVISRDNELFDSLPGSKRKIN